MEGDLTKTLIFTQVLSPGYSDEVVGAAQTGQAHATQEDRCNLSVISPKRTIGQGLTQLYRVR